MATPAPAHVQQLAGHMTNWLGRVGVRPRDFQVSFTDHYGGGGAHSAPGQMFFGSRHQPNLVSAAQRYGQRGRLKPNEVLALDALMHEMGHQVGFGRQAESVSTPARLSLEEGAAEAYKRDVLPLFLRQLFGHNMPADRRTREFGQRAYDEDVKRVRQLSVFGSGAKKGTGYKARAWRRQLLNSTPEQRDAMAAQAEAARADWGRRTGR